MRKIILGLSLSVQAMYLGCGADFRIDQESGDAPPIASTAQALSPRAELALQRAAGRLALSAKEVFLLSEAKVDEITRFKVLHPASGRIEVVDLDGRDQDVPAAQIEKTLASKRGQDFVGKLENDLRTQMAKKGADEEITVALWARLPGPPPTIDRDADASGAAGAAVTAFRQFHKDATSPLRNFVTAQGGVVEFQAEYGPLLIVKIANRKIPLLEKRGDLDAVYLARTYQSELNASVPAIDANKNWSRGYTGTGIKIAVVENDGIYFDHANLANGTYCNSTASSPVGSHASGVAGIIASTHATYKGVAYGAPALLSGNATSFNDGPIISCTEWAITNGARVINYSFGVDSTSSMVALDRYVDYVVRNRAVTMVKSAGNKAYTCASPSYNVSSPGKGWNIITVGNYKDQGTISNADDVMNMDASGGSCYGDPSSPHGDREKPEVAAPGTSITTTYCTSPNTCTGTGTGTSFSAPHVVGCAALLMQRNSTLASWPESIKAVLMASAVVNLEGSSRLSEHDGAGGIECDSADEVVSGVSGLENHTSVTSTSFPKSYTFTANAGQTVRVAIAWDSKTDVPAAGSAPTTDALQADLDLALYSPTGALLTTSASWDNSYEIVEFTAPATGTYTARVSARSFLGTSEYLGFAMWKGVREK